MIDYANRELEKPRNSLTHIQTFSPQLILCAVAIFFFSHGSPTASLICSDASLDEFIQSFFFIVVAVRYLAGVRKVFAFFSA